jgi:F-type H+-transporting ATPase subunit epsilon
MSESRIKLEIVTPDATVYSDVVDNVVIPTLNGKIDVFQKHVPLIDKLKEGDLKVKKTDGSIEYLAVGSGFVEVYDQKVSIITDQAIKVADDDDEAIDEAIKRAEEALDEGKKSDIDAAQMQLLEAAAHYERARKLAKSKSR